MRIIVQKFGGTSVANGEGRMQVVQKIKEAVTRGEHPVVVVSAMGRKGAPYATDTLIDFVHENGGAMSPFSSDLLLSCGEIISAVTMSSLLTKEGLKAQPLTGGQAGIITDACHGQAELVKAQPERLLEILEAGIIPVVAGFQGITPEGMVTTLGRGGSDTTAAMLGASIHAERIEIFTDVDGIMTADPRVCACAKIIPAMSYQEVFQMADSGAKVIHPRAVAYAMKAGIPLVIKNTFTSAKGTLIVQNVEDALPQGERTHQMISSIAHRPNRCQFIIHKSSQGVQDLLKCIADAQISIDLINIFPERYIFTIDASDAPTLIEILKQYQYVYEVLEHCIKITVIGEQMTGMPGVMAQIVAALTSAGVEIYQTADSLTTIACLIHETDVTKAINALHEAFHL